MKKSPDNSTFCLLCSKQFVSAKNLKRHANYAHKLCETPAYLCNFCHTGFVKWEDYEKHHSERLLKTFAKKTKKRKVKPAQPLYILESDAPEEEEEEEVKLEVDLNDVVCTEDNKFLNL